MPSIYLSSTFQDLGEYREAVHSQLGKLRNFRVIAMEDYVARDERPKDVCLADVAECEIYIGLFAWRYGFVPVEDNSEKRSITDLEYREAKARGRYCLIFLLDEKHPWTPGMQDSHTGENERGQKIQALRDELKLAHSVKFFTTPENLVNQVSAAVQSWQLRQTAAPTEPRHETLRHFADRMLDIIFTADTQFGVRSGRPDPRRVWLLYLNSVGRVPASLLGQRWTQDQALLEAIVAAEAGAKLGEGSSQPQGRGGWGPLCAFLQCYAHEWRRLSDKLKEPARSKANRAADSILNELKSVVLSGAFPGLSRRELAGWGELAGRIEDQPLPVYIAFDRSPHADADEIIPRAAVRLACRPEPLQNLDRLRPRLPVDGGSPDFAPSLTALLSEIEAMVPDWKPSELDLHFFMSAGQAHWASEGISLDRQTTLGSTLRCRIRLRDRHLSQPALAGNPTQRVPQPFADGKWRDCTDELPMDQVVGAHLCCCIPGPAAIIDLNDRGALIAPGLLGFPAFARPGSEGEVFRLLRAHGTVAAVWARPGPTPLPAAFIDEVRQSLHGKPLREWPEAVRRLQRRDMGAPTLALVLDPCDDAEVPGAFSVAMLRESRNRL